MGGRGVRVKGTGKTVAKNAVIPRNKLKNYLLNPNKGKGKHAVFSDLGYNMSNWKHLDRDIRGELKRASSAGLLKGGKVNKQGERHYNVDMNLGVGKKRTILTGWVVKDKKGSLHFVTAFPKKDKRG